MRLDDGGEARRQLDPAAGQPAHVVLVARMDGDEDRVPAAGPAERRLGGGDAGVAHRHLLPVRLGDGAELHGAESLRRDLPHMLDRLAVHAETRGQWLEDGVDGGEIERGAGIRGVERLGRVGGDEVHQRSRADIARQTIADAVARDGARGVERPPAVLVVAEAQASPRRHCRPRRRNAGRRGRCRAGVGTGSPDLVRHVGEAKDEHDGGRDVASRRARDRVGRAAAVQAVNSSAAGIGWCVSGAEGSAIEGSGQRPAPGAGSLSTPSVVSCRMVRPWSAGAMLPRAIDTGAMGVPSSVSAERQTGNVSASSSRQRTRCSGKAGSAGFEPRRQVAVRHRRGECGILRMLDRRNPHHLPALRVGVGRQSGGRAEHLLKQEIVADGERGRERRLGSGRPAHAEEMRLGRPLGEAASCVVPGMDAQLVVLVPDLHQRRGLEHGHACERRVAVELRRCGDSRGRAGRFPDQRPADLRQELRSCRHDTACASLRHEVHVGDRVAAVVHAVVDQPRVPGRRDAVQAGVEEALGRRPGILPVAEIVARIGEQLDQRHAEIGRQALLPARVALGDRGRPSAGGSSDSPWRGSRARARSEPPVGIPPGAAIELGRAAGLEAEARLRALRIDTGWSTRST